jgi:hypothetical protein
MLFALRLTGRILGNKALQDDPQSLNARHNMTLLQSREGKSKKG